MCIYECTGCPSLVTDSSLALTIKNFTDTEPTAIHTSGSLSSGNSAALKSNDWYTSVFQPKMKNYFKGPLVITSGTLSSEAADTGIAK